MGRFKGQFKPLDGRSLQPDFREDYAGKNFNNVRALATPGNRNEKGLLQWETSLRGLGGDKWTWEKPKRK